jgi:hypothetical protein
MKLFLVSLLIGTFALGATVTNTTKMGVKGKTVTTGAATGAGTDVSEAIDMGNMARGSVQAAGTFGTTTFTAQVSNDGSTWATAKDTAGSDITFTAAGIKYIQMGPKYLRVSAPSGNGTALIATINLSY